MMAKILAEIATGYHSRSGLKQEAKVSREDEVKSDAMFMCDEKKNEIHLY